MSLRARAALLALLLALAARAEALGLDPKKALTQYNLDVWTTESGLPQNTVTSLVQTPDGYLWIGTFGGLARFDGVRFVTFDKSTTPALPNSGVHALLPDKGGGLWVGTNGGGLTLLKDAEARTFTSADGLGGDVVRALFQDKQGRIWAGTNGGLSLFEGARFKNFGAAEGFTTSAVRAIREDASGALWIGTNGDGLFRMQQEGVFTRLTRKDGLPSDLVFSLLFDRQGALWVGTNGGGLARYADGRFKSYGAQDGLPGEIIWTLFEDRDGSLWAGTYGAGLFRREGEAFRGLTSATGLNSDFVRALAQDHEGSLWIGSNNGGLARLRDGKLTSYSAREGLPHDVAKTVLAAPDGTLWVGTSGGGLARFRSGRFESWSRREGLPNDFVQALLIDRGGALWVGTNGGGVARFAEGAFRVYSSREGLADDHVAALAEDQDGTLWIGTNAGGLSRFKDGRFTSYSRKDGLGANLVMAVLVDRHNAVWVGTDGGGLTRIRDGVLKTFTSADGLAAGSILSLYEDADGALWIGTSGSGLTRMKDGRFSGFSTKDGLHDDVVFAILEDANGGLWLSGNRGISRVEKRALLAKGEARITPQAFGVADGMKSNECSGVAQPAGTRLPDGRLVFPTPRGIVILDPLRLPRNELPPPVHVEELLAAGRVYRGPRALLPRGAADWEIRFTALSLLAPQRVRFRYRLSGFDGDWVDAGARRSAFYTQVPPGEYLFEVRASNDDGVWSPAPARLGIALAPRFHESRFFYVALALSLLLLVAGAYALRVRGLLARRRELERLVHERTEALAELQRRAEEAMHEAERQRERAERQKELAQHAGAVKTELLSIAAHDLKNPLQLVLGHSEMATLALEHGKPVGEFVGHIHLAAERMLAIVTRLLDASAMDAGALTPKVQDVDLGEVARHVVETSRAAAARKGQELGLVIERELKVAGDEELLVEVVENLVGNAIKYSPFFSRIAVSARSQDGRAFVEVKDPGPGLSEDDKRRLFGRFQRLSAKPTGGEASTGLGLSIARELAQMMGGQLHAASEGTGHGSCFGLSMPLKG